MKKLSRFMLLGLVCGLLTVTLLACGDVTTTQPVATTTAAATALTSATTTNPATAITNTPPTTTPATATATTPPTTVPATSAATTLATTAPTTPALATTAAPTTAKAVTTSRGVTSGGIPPLAGATAILNPAGFLKSQLDNFNEVEPGRDMQAFRTGDAPEKVLTNLLTNFESAGWVSDTPGLVQTKNAEALKTQNNAASMTFVKDGKIAFVFVYPFKAATQLGISEVSQNETLFLIGIADS